MDILLLVERIGEAPTAALLGMLTGVIFGIAAQRSRFCLRAATVEFARGRMNDSVAVWLLTFSTAMVWVQAASLMGWMRPEDARIVAVTGSWSGAIIGGLLFGVGMVLARGCSGRLLVLAATGNLRSLMSGLVFAVFAQMSLSGWLSPIRDRLAAMWITQGGRNMDLLAWSGLPEWGGLALGVVTALVALEVSRRNRIGFGRLVFASGVGFAVAVGWVSTFTLSQVVFDPIQIESATFTGPSANTLMFFLDYNAVLEFDIGLIPGVFLGSFIASMLAREFKFQGFSDESNMRRALTGAAFMGFGGMLAGGCAIGNGVTGTSVFAGTAWLALLCMWIGAMVTDFLLDQRHATAHA
ncbi:YeeE/YedE family protein [Sediminimonas qiaohouensis]|uniref:YeeE/YedE family protein n=1 Tax=Sediminimonas qiaohouensis TaxID=552061 RepID=UPI00041A2308|nr:YeeE/YedE family protein [Sediminimonas qiaohouensis]